MAKTIGAPRGTRDLLPEETPAWNRVEAVARDLSRRYAFERIETPLFERTELFARGLGESSDAVEKEMFRVAGAKGSEEEAAPWALRPEPTAGIVRAFIEHGMHVRPGPLRLTLIGPMFRYDRPQAGRFRQFSQWDVEVIGDPGPAVDAELVELGHRFYAEVGLTDVVAHVNSIGDADLPSGLSRGARRLLQRPRGAPERRLATSACASTRCACWTTRTWRPTWPPVRLDAIDHLCDACREHFDGVRALLDALGVRYEIDHRLVRGLDYYTRTAFEFYVAGREGQQQALGGGGRYDGLVELLGGRPTPGIGFGIGLDRTVLAMQEQGVTLPPARGAGGGARRRRRPWRAACASPRRCATPGCRSARTARPQARQAARVGREGRRAVGGHHRRRRRAGAEGPRQRRAARRPHGRRGGVRRQRMNPAPMVIVMLATMPISATITSMPAV